ncbi:hypothetical protein LOK49_Contig297G00003 [Camellia lanceoleosa]|nr:hypothetical protein LOK49_Contig297G00003 [Camellia lanceoleosa]
MKPKLEAPPPPTRRWAITDFTEVESVLSNRFKLNGSLNCRIALFSTCDSIYLQVNDTLRTEFDSLIYFKISILNTLNASNSMSRVFLYRFTQKERSYGWNDVGLSSTVLDPKLGFISNIDDTLTITTDIRILDESTSFTQDNNESSFNCGKFTWTVRNFGFLVELIKNHKLMSPSFIAEDCILRISIHRSVIDDVDYLSLFLNSEEQTEKSNWCMFRMSVLNHKSSRESIHRDSHGRIGETKPIGWIDFMEFSRFIEPNKGFLVHDHDHDHDDSTAMFSVSFQVIKESIEYPKKCVLPHKPDLFSNFYIWKIENFTKLKDRLKKRKITGLDVKSQTLKIGDQDLRLVIYPRGNKHKAL